MTESAPQQESKLPEQLLGARTVGYIDSSSFPWIDHEEEPGPITVSELKFVDGIIYVASAIPKSLRPISEIARKQDRVSDGESYGLSDMMLIKAAQIESSGQFSQSGRTDSIRGDIDADYAGLTIRAFKEGSKANTRRLYYGVSYVSEFGIKKVDESVQIDQERPILVRLALTDKANQIKALSKLTTHTTKQLKNWGAGSH